MDDQQTLIPSTADAPLTVDTPPAPPKSAAQCLDDIEATLDDSACGHAQIRALLNIVRHLLPQS